MSTANDAIRGGNAGIARSWPSILTALCASTDITADDAGWAMREIMGDAATSAQIAAFGVAMKIKGPTPAELRGLADAMLEFATPVSLTAPAVDIVGTGGDRSHTVNISTMAAVVVAASGVPVVKHGNRAASSKSGGADVLEALGVKIGLGAASVERTVSELGIGFCFAPVFHPAFRFTGSARKEIGIPTVFNVLGPLTNPARPTAGLVGCAFEDLAEVVAGVFAERRHNALIVRGHDGLDELTTTAPSDVWVAADGVITRSVLDPTDLGLPRVELAELRGGDAAANAAIARAVFAGDRGPVRDAVLLNAAGAVVAFEGTAADGDLVGALRGALTRVADAVDAGHAAALLDTWAQLSQQLT